MTYKLNPEAKGFSYTREELFECITKIVAHPHTAITKHDQSRALAIMVVFDDYFSNYVSVIIMVGIMFMNKMQLTLLIL
jgi:hypothetical protein